MTLYVRFGSYLIVVGQNGHDNESRTHGFSGSRVKLKVDIAKCRHEEHSSFTAARRPRSYAYPPDLTHAAWRLSWRITCSLDVDKHVSHRLERLFHKWYGSRSRGPRLMTFYERLERKLQG